MVDQNILDHVAEMDTSDAEKANHDLRTFRKGQYPSIEEQLDMIWHLVDQDIIDGKDSVWYTTIKDIKDNYPVR